MKKAIVITSKNLGDGLIFAVLADHLAKSDRIVTLYSPLLTSLESWMPQIEVRAMPSYKELQNAFKESDEIFVEMHDAPVIQEIYNEREQFKGKLRFLCPIGSQFKLSDEDYVFDRNRCMVDNVLSFIETLGIEKSPKEYSLRLTPPRGLKHRAHSRRILLHALSANTVKNYPLRKFLTIAEELQNRGYEPIFLAHEKEYFEAPFPVFTFKSADELAAYTYESGYFIGNDSGPGHLASLLNIPGIIITKSEKKSRLWRPGWSPMQVLYPPNWVPNLKCCRLRDLYWDVLIPTKRVGTAFKAISMS